MNSTSQSDADRQLAHYLACKGNGTLIQVRQAGTKFCSKASSKAHASGIKHARKKMFKWLFNTNGKNIPVKNKFGIP